MSDRYMLLTLKVVDRVDGRKLGRKHLEGRRAVYFERSERGTEYVGMFPTDRCAKAVWRGRLRSEGVVA